MLRRNNFITMRPYQDSERSFEPVARVPHLRAARDQRRNRGNAAGINA